MTPGPTLTSHRHVLLKGLALFFAVSIGAPIPLFAQSLSETPLSSSEKENTGITVRVGVMNAAAVELENDFNLITVSVPIVHYQNDWSSVSPTLTGLADLNPNETPFLLSKPNRFVISDGTLWKPFIAVDRSSDSKLDLALKAFIRKTFGSSSIAKIRARRTENQILERLNSELPNLIRFQTNQFANNPLERFEESVLSRSTSLKVQYDDERARVFKLALDNYQQSRSINNLIFKTDIAFPAVPLEQYLTVGEGRCIHIALTASLILETLRIPHRLVLGSNVIDEVGGRGVGHSWIELPDGRIFDAAWNMISPPGERHSKHPDWFKFGNEKGQSFRFPYERFNMMAY